MNTAPQLSGISDCYLQYRIEQDLHRFFIFAIYPDQFNFLWCCGDRKIKNEWEEWQNENVTNVVILKK
jgi:hypothetical protein